MKPILLCTVIGAAAVLASCGGGAPPRPSAAPASAPIAVQSVTVATQDWPAVYEATGTVRARSTVVISSKVMGYVQQVNFQASEHVKEGQTLVTLEARDLEANLRRAEAGRAELQSAIPEADQAVAAAKANLDLAQITFKRMEDLAGKKSISNQEFDEAAARLKSAQANHAMMRARRTQLDARMAQAVQEIRAATVVHDYARITAPFSGVVTAKSVEPGTLASPGAPLLTLERDGVYRLEASVDESRLPAIRLGQTVQVAFESLDRKLDARVSEIVPTVDATSRAYTVKIDLPAVPQLRSGLFGRALFPLASRKIVVVPRTALIERGQLVSIFVAEEGAARARLVTAGERFQDSVEILSGLTAGEKVIAPVPSGLVDGSRVEVRQ